jgi:hypothetical protein
VSIVPWYHGTMKARPTEPAENPDPPRTTVDRVQTGVRIEKRMLMVLRALADAKDLSLGDLIEGIVLHAFEGKPPFQRATLDQITKLKEVFGLRLTAADSHELMESGQRGHARRRSEGRS